MEFESFYYLMKLHYSQTCPVIVSCRALFYYLMKLHYSQIGLDLFPEKDKVLLPYEITLFSNGFTGFVWISSVLLPYEITLFSNRSNALLKCTPVLLPYEITLFSNNQ